MNELEYQVRIFDAESGMFKSYTPKIYSNNQWKPIVPYTDVNNEWQTPKLRLDIEDIPEEVQNECCLTFSSPTSFTMQWGDGAHPLTCDGKLYYSTNKTTWTEWTGTSVSAVNNNGYKIYLRGKNNTIITGYVQDFTQIGLHFVGSNISISGNIATLLNWEIVALDNLPLMENYAFYGLFAPDGWWYLYGGESNSYMTSIVNTNNLILPYMNLTNHCYDSMFANCQSLINTPLLPATNLADDCYTNMFVGCTSLVTPPNLPATTLTTRCYINMFTGCSSLTTTPILPAITLANGCYMCMFEGCTSLTTISTISGFNLDVQCYYQMFKGCTSLTIAPNLSATTLASYCYEGMFSDCTSLTTVPLISATVLSEFCCSHMFSGCTSLITLPRLSATELPRYCYSGMFYGCSKIKLSTTQTGEYQTVYRIPTTGNGTADRDAFQNMFTDTGGTFTGAPSINTTYYTSNTIIS